jgi:hypothetical protein
MAAAVAALSFLTLSLLLLVLAHQAPGAAARPTSGGGVGGTQWGAPSSYGGSRSPYGPDGNGNGNGNGGGGYGMYDYDYDYAEGVGAGRRERGSTLPAPSMSGRGRQPLDARRRATQRAGARGEWVGWDWFSGGLLLVHRTHPLARHAMYM